jgi:hypothetical protein
MGRMTSPMPNRLDRRIKRINYAYNTLAIVSVAKWRGVRDGSQKRGDTALKLHKKVVKSCNNSVPTFPPLAINLIPIAGRYSYSTASQFTLMKVSGLR